MILISIGIIATLVGLFLIARSQISKENVTKKEVFWISLSVISFLLFAMGLFFHEGAFGEAIDPVDTCYLPFNKDHSPTLLWYCGLHFIAIFLSWKKLHKLSPVVKALVLAVLAIATVFFTALFIQVISHNTSEWDMYKGNDGTGFFIWFPAVMMVLGIFFIMKILNLESETSANRSYKNALLQRFNSFLADRKNLPLGVLVLLFPFLIISTVILIIFGQQYDSAVKVFTETYLWTFSQHVPPPPLDHRGHYLCTVAAKGSPEIVKPKYIGSRGGQKIIVNRQLQIANAFEGIIENKFPIIHNFIRKNYDKYGYNLSRKITSSALSNLTYLLMKPLEIFFLIFIYTFDTNPENRIARQYL